MSDSGSGRHPFRFLFKFAMLVGLIALISKVVAANKGQFVGLTESEVRAKFEAKLGRRMGTDTATEIANMVIPKLKEKGIIKPDPVEEAADDSEAADDTSSD